MWRVETKRRSAILKAHRQGRKYSQELTVYTEWLPRLRGELPRGVRVAELLAHRGKHPRALLLSPLQGSVMLGSRFAPSLERRLHDRAGAFARALHALQLPDADPVPLTDAYVMRLEAWSERAAGLLPASVTEAVSERLHEALPFLAAQRRVPLHHDFSPRNWLATPDGVLAVIDFEHARQDLHLAEFLRLWATLWPKRPDLEEAFLSGYGRALTGEERGALERMGALWALSTVVWAREHADREFEREGLTVLERLGLA